MKRHRSTDAGHDGSESYGVCQTCVADALDVGDLELIEELLLREGVLGTTLTKVRALAERQQDAATDEAEKEWAKPLPNVL